MSNDSSPTRQAGEFSKNLAPATGQNQLLIVGEFISNCRIPTTTRKDRRIIVCEVFTIIIRRVIIRGFRGAVFSAWGPGMVRQAAL